MGTERGVLTGDVWLFDMTTIITSPSHRPVSGLMKSPCYPKSGKYTTRNLMSCLYFAKCETNAGNFLIWQLSTRGSVMLEWALIEALSNLVQADIMLCSACHGWFERLVMVRVRILEIILDNLHIIIHAIRCWRSWIWNWFSSHMCQNPM